MLMSAVEIRAEIQSYLEQVKDESFLKVVHSMLGTYVQELEDSIIGYEADGSPVTASVAKAQFAEDLSKPEEFMSVEDFEKELDQLTA
jgi:hypothetical protein